MKITFYKWIKRGLKENDPIGDLAHDIYLDSNNAQKLKNNEAWIRYLKRRGAREEVIRTLEDAWNYYKKI